MTLLLSFSIIRPIQAQPGETSEKYTKIRYTGMVSGKDVPVTRFQTPLGDAYCLEPGIMFISGFKNTMTFAEYQKLTLETKKKVEIIDYYGKVNGSHLDNGVQSDQWFAVSQFMIWDAVKPGVIERIVPTLHGDMTPADFWAKKAIIDRQIARHEIRPSFHNTSVSLYVGESVSLTDTNQLLDEFNLKSNSSAVSVVQNGNTLTLTANSKGTAIITGKKVPEHYVGATLVYYDGQSQDVGIMKISDPIYTNLNINVLSFGSVILRKNNEAGTGIANTTFAFSKNADMSSATSYTTGTDGTVTISNLKAGTYYVQETNVPAPLILDNTIKSVTVVAGQDSTFTAVNKAAMGKISVTKVDPSNKAYAGAIYSIRNASGTEVTRVTTGSNGTGTSIELPLGTYTVVEIKAPAPLILDPTPVSVTLAYKDMHTSVVNDTVVQTNKKAVGQITITKNGEGEVLAGTVFDVLNAQGRVVDTITTGTNGKATTKELPLGKYTLVEKSVPAPYLLNSAPIAAELVYEDQTVKVVKTNVSQTNEKPLGRISIRKSDSEIQGEYLANGVYEIRTLDGIVVDTLTTNAEGYAQSKLLPLGQYRVVEITPPEGFLLDTTTHLVELKYKDQLTQEVSTHLDTVDQPIKAPIQIVKVDANNEEIPVEGAVFEVLSLPDRKVIEKITTNIDGFAYSSPLRYGNYLIREVEAPVQFYLNPNEYPVSIREHDKVMVQYIANDKILIKLGLEKVDGETNSPLANAVFEVHDAHGNPVTFEYLDDNYNVVTQTHLTTNEAGKAFTRGFLKYGKYTLVEVEAPKGYVKAQPIEFTIDRDTHFVDLAVIGRTTIQNVSNSPTTTELRKIDVYGKSVAGAQLQLLDGEEIVAEFVSTDKAFVAKGLEIGKTYTLKEIKAPEGYLLSEPVSITIEETSEVQVLEMINELVPELKTTALFEEGIKESLPKEKLVVVDEVEVTNLWVGKEYTVKGQLVDASTEEVLAKGETTFVAEAETQVVKVRFELEGVALAGTTMVVFEDLYKDNRLLASHHKLTDEDQTVYIPKIKTTATDVVGNKEVLPIPEVTIVDVVEYTNLNVGEVYTLKGKLVRKDTQEVLVSNETTFIPTTTNGTVELEYVVNTSLLQGKEVVVFEEVYNQDVLIAVHADINDLGQTVKVTKPSVGTSASDPEGRKEVLPVEEVTIVDVVEYENLVVGKEYTLKGELVRKDTRDVIATASNTFVADKANGSEQLSFVFDASLLQGQEVVVFEDLLYEDHLIARHVDIHDQGQTVKVTEPKVKTSASSTERKPEAPMMVTIVDVVTYDNLIVGKEYTIQGKLMDKATNQPFLADGKEVTSSLTFIANEKNGIVELVFTFDQKYLSKTTLVVFENLLHENQILATHADINDVEQSVEIIEIAIRKVDSVDKTKVLKNAEFTLYQNGLELAKVKTDDDGIARFLVEEGAYQLKETKAPAGYRLSSEIIEVEANKGLENQLFEVTALNTPLPDELVKTGVASTTMLTLSGISLATAGIYLLTKKKKEED